MRLPSFHVRLLWAGLAALSGLLLITYSPRLPGDLFPVVAILTLAAGLFLRLRSGPLLFFGVWLTGELRPLLPNPHGLTWSGLPGSPEAGSTAAMAITAVLFLFASCQYQFLVAGSQVKTKDPFVITLPDAAPGAAWLRFAGAIALRAVLIATMVFLFEAGAGWASETEIGYTFGEFARTGALFWQAALAFVVLTVLLDLARFFTLDRTSAACYLNDIVWHAHRKIWAFIDKRTA